MHSVRHSRGRGCFAGYWRTGYVQSLCFYEHVQEQAHIDEVTLVESDSDSNSSTSSGASSSSADEKRLKFQLLTDVVWKSWTKWIGGQVLCVLSFFFATPQGSKGRFYRVNFRKPWLLLAARGALNLKSSTTFLLSPFHFPSYLSRFECKVQGRCEGGLNCRICLQSP